MGGFVTVIVALLVAVWLALSPFSQNTRSVSPTLTRIPAQAVAANMVEFHRAAVSFVSQTANKSLNWTFSYLSQATVRCSPYASASYTTYVPAGCTGTATALQMPGYMSDTVATYDWVVCYRTGSPNIVVTYSRNGENPGGYSPTDLAAALTDYNITNSFSTWYWGVVATGPAMATPTALTLPSCTTAVPVGAIALATTIP